MTNNADREAFKREERYIVLKIRDVKDGLSSLQLEQLKGICKAIEHYRASVLRPPLVGAVVEADWPEYEPVWAMIEARVTGQARAQASDVPDGWKLVPKKASQRMLNAFGTQEICWCEDDGKTGHRPATGQDIWEAMLSAAPKPPKSTSVPVEGLEAFLKLYFSRMDNYVAIKFAELIAEYKA